MYFYPRKQQFLLVSDSFIKPQKTTTAAQTRKILICIGLPSPYFRVTVNVTDVVAGHLNGQPFVIFRHSCTSLQHSSLFASVSRALGMVLPCKTSR